MKIDLQVTDIILIGISSIIYMVFVLGLLILFKDLFIGQYNKIKMKKRLMARRRELKEQSKLEKHLQQILTISMKRPIGPEKFLGLTGLIFLIVIIVGVQNTSIAWSFLMAVLISVMPYLLLRVRLETIRRKGSYEGEGLIAEFLSQYRIQDHNIYKTIEHVILESENMKTSGKLLFKLLLEIRNTGKATVIKDATDKFAYGINTNWGRMLANNIRISAERGSNVSLALEDILIQLREARVAAEERKRLNSEAVRIVLFVVPIMYVATIIMSVKYLDLPVRKFIINQFYTSQGFLFFTIIIFLFLINLAIVEMVNNQRFDY